ncbi:unnamed protein product [Paramecium pentaurelia]|uniref:Transmembrane protein n=1 Tax=Paramecium pentaurelia TaxID=43138 RepID=A0A8S1RW91_9CILI|nr:unnamed protein product [Paramecium pentaurelia]
MSLSESLFQLISQIIELLNDLDMETLNVEKILNFNIMIIIFISFFVAIAEQTTFYGTTLNIFKNYINVQQTATSFLNKVHERTEQHEEIFKKFLSILERIDDLYDQQEKLLIFNDANIEYVLKKTRKNYNDKINQISANIDKNSEQLEKLEQNLQKNNTASLKIIEELKNLSSLIQEVLKDNFSINYQKVIPFLNEKIQSQYFSQLQKLKTLDYQLLVKELEKYSSFIQQQTIKESKKRDLANCYSLINSVLKQALILLLSEKQQQQYEVSIKALIIREDNKQLTQQLQQIKRLKRLFEDSQEFKITLMKQYRENIKFVQFKKKQFREQARKIIEVNEEKTKMFINEENILNQYIQ